MRLLLATLAASLATGALAQQKQEDPDVATLAKWSAAKVVRWHLDGKGPQASDTVTIDLDWELKERRVLGQPAIRNGARSSLQVSSVQSGPGARIRLVGANPMELPMPSPMLLALPPGPSANIAITADRKSFLVKSGSGSWTYTPSLP